MCRHGIYIPLLIKYQYSRSLFNPLWMVLSLEPWYMIWVETFFFSYTWKDFLQCTWNASIVLSHYHLCVVVMILFETNMFDMSEEKWAENHDLSVQIDMLIPKTVLCCHLLYWHGYMQKRTFTLPICSFSTYHGWPHDVAMFMPHVGVWEGNMWVWNNEKKIDK